MAPGRLLRASLLSLRNTESSQCFRGSSSLPRSMASVSTDSSSAEGSRAPRRPMAKHSWFIAVLALCVAGTPEALGQGKGQGAIVIRDDAPIYAKSTGSERGDTRMRGDYVVGVTTMGLHRTFQFEDEDGRLSVNFFRDKDQKGVPRIGWMDPADLAQFTYECGCGPRKQPCSPYSSQGFILRWNVCFSEARDKKLAELRLAQAQGESGPGAAQVPPQPAAKLAEKPLTNDDVIGMVKAGLGDELT